MSASKALKEAGLPGGVKQCAEMCGKSMDTIQNWYRDNYELFEIVALGCVELLRQRKMIEKALSSKKIN
jgi:Zn ribbon nucleic-acid-binding protein